MSPNLRILVVEDMPADVELMAHELRRAGVSPHCHRVESQEQFVAELDSRTPDLILSDHGVPGFDAKTAFQIAREYCPEVPFIVVTGSTAEFDAQLPLSADGYVRKSHLIQLWPVVRQAMEGGAARAPLDEAPLCRICFNLADLARDIMQDSIRYAAGREVEWVIKPLPDVVADPALLSRALRILVDNSLNLTRDQALARIEIGGNQRNARVVIYVSDNSSPDSTKREKLLRFFGQHQPERDLEIAPELTPLDKVRQIARRHGGRTWAEDLPGHGTKFTMVLPFEPTAQFDSGGTGP